jgi:ATP-binding cassette, subfamily B, multidrug efflux pump
MAVGYVVNQYQRGTAALSRIAEILDVAIAPRYEVSGAEIPPQAVAGSIEIRRLTFAFAPGQTPVLKNINVTIPAGAVCGIVGETGSGKSTLIHLLLRLYEPPDGTISADGVDIKKLPLRKLEEAIGFVAQDVFLFSGSIRDNILFGVENGESQRIEEAAGIAQLLPTVLSFNTQFDTVIGERGVRLSGGQKQRTALARAIIKNPPILILDDAFSSVDVETEEEILRQLKRFMKGRTTLLISHRISTVREADMIIYLRAGEIIEQGSHDELVARQGAYYQLFQRQRLIREVESLSHEEGRP